MGIDLLYGYAGQLSFGHIGFFAIGAYGVGILAKFAGVPFLGGLVAALVLNVALGFLLGRIFLRLSGSYFMLGTLAFGIMVYAVISVWSPVTGGEAGLGGIPRPRLGLLSPDLEFGVIVWVVALVLFWLALNLAQSRVGRAMLAVRSDEVSAACSGVNVARLKTNIFALSAGFASISGSLFGAFNGAVHPHTFSLQALLDVLLMLFFGGEATVWGGLLGATLMRALPDLSGPLQAGKILFSGVLFAVIIFAFPRGVAGAIASLLARYSRRRKTNASAPATPADASPRAPGNGRAVLEIANASRSFGGLRAVDAVSFNVTRGQIKSLIGPNGAGKSTLLNLVSGVQRPDDGRIVFEGHELSGRRSDEIARLGIQRTFQHERLFTRLSVIENVMVGCEGGSNGGAADLLRCALALPQTLRDEARVREEAARWLAVIGLAERADEPVAVLPHGLRKLVEVARAVAGRPSLLLLDETAAGLNDAEKASFKALIRRLQSAGVTVLLIEHDMEFVMELSDEVVVVDFGRRIAEGTPATVRRDPAVPTAYLGA
jgi:ABC-type branched-subunit amino acid transport system ATPase component/ABC-type branched-subunit amino acid transport system permease subunit